jgi:DNA-binding XRE family transcriptional regulator
MCGPFVIRLRGRIPYPAGYPETPRTLADHLKKARLDRGIPQRDAARAIGCSPLTFLHWEKGRVAPDVRFWPAILRFLGFDPRPEPEGLWRPGEAQRGQGSEAFHHHAGAHAGYD